MCAIFTLYIAYFFPENGTNHKDSMYVSISAFIGPFIELVGQMGIFGAFGGASVIAGYLVGAIFALFTYFSSQKLHKVGHST